ncbi:MAG: CRISPR-associated protein Cas4, partial [Lachnospiraceae bacterium]|nr:CRISPR-associated protein Cas4 [Lachnospiraceae bacterium]
MYSNKYNLRGICDNVEFHKASDGVYIDFLEDKYIPFPIEYKHGRKRNKQEYNVQLMAQALCMEEMYGISLPHGYIYYTSARERVQIEFEDDLRILTKSKIRELSEFIENPILEQAKYMKRCPKCSVYDICEPKNQMISRYMNSLWKRI